MSFGAVADASGSCRVPSHWFCTRDCVPGKPCNGTIRLHPLGDRSKRLASWV